MLRFVSCPHIDNSHIWRPKECMLWQIFLSLHVWQFSVTWYIRKKFCNIYAWVFFFVLPTLTSFQSWGEILQSRIKSNSFVEMGRCTNYLQNVIPARISNVRLVRNNSGVQIFCNDEKARQRHLPKMYTLVVTMNWNRFCNIFVLDFVSFATDLNSAIVLTQWA